MSVQIEIVIFLIRQYISTSECHFLFMVPCIINPCYECPTRCKSMQFIFISLQDHSTCFGRLSHPSSGVRKTVVTAIGTSHISR